ncbi:MAG: hypothetical protein WAO52_17290 [Prolixibacteraceae bacterium]
MKTRFYSLFFLLILIGYILRPVLPIVEYALNKDYIAKNLCINRDKPKSCCEGKCHLKKELAKSDTSEDSEQNNSPKKTQRHIDEFIKTQAKTSGLSGNELHYPARSELSVHQRCLPVIFVPPQFS